MDPHLNDPIHYSHTNWNNLYRFDNRFHWQNVKVDVRYSQGLKGEREVVDHNSQKFSSSVRRAKYDRRVPPTLNVKGLCSYKITRMTG